MPIYNAIAHANSTYAIRKEERSKQKQKIGIKSEIIAMPWLMVYLAKRCISTKIIDCRDILNVCHSQ